jgi:hypothetical protein
MLLPRSIDTASGFQPSTLLIGPAPSRTARPEDCPGSYLIRGGLTTQFSCDGTIPGVTEPIGMIVVQ